MRKIHKACGNNQMMNRYLTVEIISILVVLTFTLSSCSLPIRQSAVPLQLTEKAEVVGLPGVRHVVRADMQEFIRETMESYYRVQQGQVGALPPANFLALSGGGDNGAFGSGLLSGWTATGNRPEFKGVTGISTGALIAPFAFLGPKYDTSLKEVFTRSTPKDILEARYFMAALFNDAMADNAPLEQLLKKHVTEDMLKEIAREDAKGRLLVMATTNLDANQGVIWNMGKIAASGGSVINFPKYVDGSILDGRLQHAPSFGLCGVALHPQHNSCQRRDLLSMRFRLVYPGIWQQRRRLYARAGAVLGSSV